jgi:hypothetical protein
MSAAALVVSVASYGLTGTEPAIGRAPLDDDGWRQLVAVVTAQRLSGLLARAVADGALPTTAAQRDEVHRLERAAAATSLALERVLLEVADRLDAEGIDHRVLKGPALAHGVYAEPSWREFGDVDVLVPSEAFDDALALLLRDGGRRRFLEPRPRFTRRFGKGVAIERADGFEVDLHRTFVSGPYGMTVRLPSLFEQPTPFVLGDRTLLGLGTVDRFIHACFHVALGSVGPRLVPTRDVAELLLHAPPPFEAARDRWERWRAGAVVARGITLARDTFDLTAPSPYLEWASAFRPTAAEQRTIGLYLGRSERYHRQVLPTLRVIPRATDKARFALALLFPSREYLAQREGAYRARLRRAVSLRIARPGRPT